MQQSTPEETTRLLDEEELEFLSDIATAEAEAAHAESDGAEKNRAQENTSPRGIRRVITHASATERGIMAVVLALIVLLISLGIVMVRVHSVQSAVQAFESIGQELQGVGVIGADGLQTVERISKKAAEDAERERLDLLRRQEKDALVPAEDAVVVTIALQTVVRDLKIKFLDRDAGTVIRGVPFAATVTDPDGKKQMVTDEDADGIIHLTGLAPGSYDVGWGVIEDEAFRNYIFDDIVRRATVLDQAEYKKVDVSDEVITPGEMPADSVVRGMQGAGVEGRPADTVEFVESAKVMVSGGEEYIEIPRSEIKDPAALSRAKPAVTLQLLRYTTGEDDSSGTGATGNTEDSSATQTEDSAQGTDDTGEENSGTGSSAEEGTSQTTEEDEVVLPPEDTGTELQPENAETDTGNGESTEPLPPEIAPDTPLQTLDGQTVYVRNLNGLFVPATAADYADDGTVFYRKVTAEDGEYQYTGWQTIQGKLYYFDKNHNAVTGQQTIGGVKYVFREDGSLIQGNSDKGIDVSAWNGEIDWNAVRGAGISYAVIRLGYRGSVTSRLTNDTAYHKNMQGATAAGLRVGVYFVTQAVNETEAIEEASYCLSLLGSYPVSLPVFLDVEKSGGRGDKIDMKTRTAVCKAFCRTIANGGYRAGVYANKDWMTNYIDMTQLTDYCIWMAQYNTEPTYNKTRIDLWQHSCEGKIPGIKGDVDLNISYVNW
ncbi:MAG: hypothetical protein IK016_01320 [Lachnospiraceae bacterium]|nr:hypothetical protein [Lachnospiraceae bacterium]